jgi:hypothetical protein
VNPEIWWYVARATGLVAWALATVAVLWGLFLHTRALGPKPTKPWLLDLHRHLGALTVGFIALHIGALVADSFVHFSVVDVLVPFASDWKPGPVAWGVVATYAFVAVQLTSVFMRRVPKKVWRRVHLTSYLAFVAATIHGITAGTDLGNPVVQWTLAAGLLLLTFFGVYRQLGEKQSTPDRRADALARARAQAMKADDPQPEKRARSTAMSDSTAEMSTRVSQGSPRSSR